MRNNLPKITLLFVIGTIIYSCSLVKRVPEGKQLLAKNEIIVNEKQVKEERISNLLVQQPNSNIGGFPLRLHIFNLAKKNIKNQLNPLFKLTDLVKIDTLPRTASNKVMRRKLRELYESK